MIERRGRVGERGLAPWIAFGAFLIGYFGWRIAVFGHWAPNSYYAKTSSLRMNEVRDGLEYVGRFAASVAGAVLLVLAACGPLAALAGRWREPELRRRHGVLVVSALVSIATVVFSGGDSYLGARFLTPAVALTLAATALAATGLRGAERWAFAGALVVLATVQTVAALEHAPQKLRAVAGGPMREADFACNARIAERLTSIAPEARIAQHDIQWLKYFSDETYVLDTSGLNSHAVAHRPVADRLYFAKDGIDLALEEGIEVLHCDFRWTSATPMAQHTLEELLGQPELGERFFGHVYSGDIARQLLGRYRPVSLPEACGETYFNVLVRADLVERFEQAGCLVGD